MDYLFNVLFVFFFASMGVGVDLPMTMQIGPTKQERKKCPPTDDPEDDESK